MSLGERFIWHDPNLGNEENQKYLDDFRRQGYEVESFKTPEEVEQFLRGKVRAMWAVLTSGSGARRLLPLIHPLKQVVGVVVFCGNLELHTPLKEQYSKVKGVFTDVKASTNELLRIFDKITVVEACGMVVGDRTADAFSMQLAHELHPGYQYQHQSKMPWNSEFHCVTPGLAVAFKRVVESSQSENPYELAEIQAELESLIRMVGKPHCEDDVAKLRKLWHDGPCSSPKENGSCLEKLSWTYTAQEPTIYTLINNVCMAKSNFRPVEKYLSTFVREAKAAEEASPAEFGILYRGLKKLRSEYVEGQEFYWPAFTSTSVEEYVAESEDFGGQGHMTKFIITRADKSRRHPSMDLITYRHCHCFPDEREVLLFPFFKGRVTSISDQRRYNTSPFPTCRVVKVEELPSVFLEKVDWFQQWWPGFSAELTSGIRNAMAQPMNAAFREEIYTFELRSHRGSGSDAEVTLSDDGETLTVLKQVPVALVLPPPHDEPSVRTVTFLVTSVEGEADWATTITAQILTGLPTPQPDRTQISNTCVLKISKQKNMAFFGLFAEHGKCLARLVVPSNAIMGRPALAEMLVQAPSRGRAPMEAHKGYIDRMFQGLKKLIFNLCKELNANMSELYDLYTGKLSAVYRVLSKEACGSDVASEVKKTVQMILAVVQDCLEQVESLREKAIREQAARACEHMHRSVEEVVEERRHMQEHTVLCLDESDSMSGEPWRDMCAAAQEVLTNTRIGGRVSVVQFANKARLTHECITKCSDSDRLSLEQRVGGTSYRDGFAMALNVCRNLSPDYQKKLVFMSDGCDQGTQDALLKFLREEFQDEKIRRLQYVSVLFKHNYSTGDAAKRMDEINKLIQSLTYQEEPRGGGGHEGGGYPEEQRREEQRREEQRLERQKVLIAENAEQLRRHFRAHAGSLFDAPSRRVITWLADSFRPQGDCIFCPRCRTSVAEFESCVWVCSEHKITFNCIFCHMPDLERDGPASVISGARFRARDMILKRDELAKNKLDDVPNYVDMVVEGLGSLDRQLEEQLDKMCTSNVPRLVNHMKIHFQNLMDK